MNSSSMQQLLVAASLLMADGAFAGSEKSPDKNAAAIEPVHPMYLGSFNTGLKVNDAYTEGNFSIVAPVWSSLGADATLSGGVFFIEPYISWGEQGEVASSVGLGYRHLIGRQGVKALTHHDGHQASFMEEGVVLGGNLFLDMLDTETNHQFWQLGVGAEILTRYVELRGNYYIPLTDRKEVGSFRTQETVQSTSQQTSTVGAEPQASGNSIMQPYSQVTTQTTTTTTIERLFRRYEEGMEGWDVELGLLLPWVDRFMDAKVIAGYYAFDNQPFGPQTGGAGNVEGWKAGLELRPVPALVLNGTWYEDERLTGADWTAGVRLEIPFEGGDLGDGKTFWSRIGDAFKPRRRHLAERMAEPVRRQNAAVKLARSQEEDRDEQQTSVKTVTKVVSQSQGQLVLADDIVFVNNGPAVGNGIQAGSAAGTGTAESPVLTMQAGAAIAGPNSTATGRLWSVYTQGVAASYTGDVTLTGSTNFIGSGQALTGLSGRSFGSGPAPTLAGGIEAGGVGALGVTGYIITGGLSGSGRGVNVADVSSVTLESNTFRNSVSEAVRVETNGATITSLVVAGNTFEASGVHGLEITTNDVSSVNARVSGNTFTGNFADDINTDSFDFSAMTLVASGNSFTDTTDSAFDVQVFDDAVGTFTATGNVVTHTGDDSFLFDAQGDAMLTAVISGNNISDSDFDAVTGAVLDDATLNVTVSGNTIIATDQRAIELGNFGANLATLNATISGNFIALVGFEGIALGNFSIGSGLNATVSGNTITAGLSDGIYVEIDSGGASSLTFTGNTIQDVDGYGLHVDSGGASDTDAVITGNRIMDVAFAGLGTHAFGSTVFDVTSLSDNVIAGSGMGIEAFTDAAPATLRVAGFNGNTVTGHATDGIELDAFAGSTLEFNGTLNNTVGPHPGGFRLESIGSPAGTLRINGALIVLPVDVP